MPYSPLVMLLLRSVQLFYALGRRALAEYFPKDAFRHAFACQLPGDFVGRISLRHFPSGWETRSAHDHALLGPGEDFQLLLDLGGCPKSC